MAHFTDDLDGIEVGSAEASAVFVILHGLGADGHDFEPVAQHLHRRLGGAMRFVLPHAPVRAVTVNGGFRMRAWYDLLNMGEVRALDWESLAESRDAIRRLLQDLRNNGVTKLFLGGFSQGAALSLFTALDGSEVVDGVVALSGYWPHQSGKPPSEVPPVPVFLAHGTGDSIVPLVLARTARRELEDLGISVDYNEYPMAHSVCAEEIESLAKWLQGQLGSASG